MTKAQHTPTPWHIESVATSAFSARVFICDANGSRVTDINCGDNDAKFIIRAVNSHDALVEALEVLAKRENSESVFRMQEIARTALKLAREESNYEQTTI